MWTRRIGFSESSFGLNGGRDTKMDELAFKSFKHQLPENSIINISSLIFNLENNKEEVLNKYSCFYNPSLEAFCILIEENTKYADLSKEIVISLMDFAQKLEIKSVILCLDRKNKDYVKILQGMMTVGFVNENSTKTAQIGNKIYKVLRMNIKASIEEIEEMAF